MAVRPCVRQSGLQEWSGSLLVEDSDALSSRSYDRLLETHGRELIRKKAIQLNSGYFVRAIHQLHYQVAQTLVAVYTLIPLPPMISGRDSDAWMTSEGTAINKMFSTAPPESACALRTNVFTAFALIPMALGVFFGSSESNGRGSFPSSSLSLATAG